MNSRYERNRRYYLKNRIASMRATVLHNVKTHGRLPKFATLQKYEISLQEFTKYLNMYFSKLDITLNKLPKIKQVKIAKLMQFT